MNRLSENTLIIVRKMFSSEQLGEAVLFLEGECGNNLGFCEYFDEVKLERYRFAVLKLSEGKMEALLGAIQLAQTDWRDLLMAAGFGHDVTEHDRWADSYLGKN